MNLKRTLAILIALSMLVGLMFTVPAAALTPVEGYAETVVIDETFDKSFSDKLTVFNGSVEEGALNFTLSSSSSMAINKGFDTKNNKQVIVDFDMTTTKEYKEDPWSASYIGFRLDRTQAKPSDPVCGAWVGITTKKIILWFSHKLAMWGSEDAVEGEDYLVLDAPFDLSSASYRVIYETVAVKDKSTVNVEKAELYANDGENEALIASFDFVIGTRLKSDGKTEENYITREVTLTSGDNVLTSAVEFVDDPASRYFSIYNAVVEAPEDDPLAPQDPEDYLPPEDSEDETDEEISEDVDAELQAIGEIEEVSEVELFVAEEETEEYPVVTIDNLKVAYFNDLLVTDETRENLNAKKAEFEAVINAYNTDDNAADDVYIANSLDIEAIEEAIAVIDEILATEGLLDADVQTMLKELDGVLADAVTAEIAAKYPGRFKNYEEIIEELLADPDSGYSEERLNAIQDKIEAAKDLLNEEFVTKGMLDDAYDSVLKDVSALNVKTENGIPDYTQSFTSATTNLSDWWETGEINSDDVASGENGAIVRLRFKPTRGRFNLGFNKIYKNPHSAKATLTVIEGARYASMLVRQQLLAGNWHEYTKVEAIGSHGASLQTINGNFNTTYLVMVGGRKQEYATKEFIIRIPFNLSEIGEDAGVELTAQGGKQATFLIKDFGDLIEFYAVSTDGATNVKLAELLIYPETSTVSGYGTCHTSGKVINAVTGEELEFNNMAITPMESGHIGFAARELTMGVKDFEVSGNIMTKEEIAYVDGTKAPKDIEIVLPEQINVGVEYDFKVNANSDEEWLKIAAKDEYVSGSTEITKSSGLKVETTLGEEIVSIDTNTGKITGNRKGSDIITVSYGELEPVKILVTVTDDEYTAPTEEDKYEGRIVAARFANATVFKSVEVDSEIVPVIEYEYPNGDTGILPDGCYVDYVSENVDIMEYDATKGAYVAKAKGIAELYAKVYMTASDEPVESEHIKVEVTALGEATLGAGTNAAANALVSSANDVLTTEEKKALIDKAIEEKIAIPYSDELDIELIFNEIASVSADEELSDLEIIETAVKNVAAVRPVYEIAANPESTADDLAKLIFGDGGIYEELGISREKAIKYYDLTSTKSSRVMTRLLTQIEKMGTDIIAKNIVKSFDTIYKSVKDGGGSPKGDTKDITDRNNGNVVFTPTIPVKPAEPVKEVITAEQINAAAAKFADTNDAAWAKDAIGTLVHKGIINGYEDATIRPNGMITRDEFVKLLVVTFELDIKQDAYNYFYEDVPASGWQVPYIAAAHEANILSGTNGGAFGSNVRITRQDMASMIYKAVLMKKATLPSDNIVAFTDAENIVDYAKEAVNKLAAAGVISGMGDGTFAPGAGATRAQAFQMIYLILEVM